ALTSSDSHITEWMTTAISPMVGNLSGIIYVILVAVLAGFVTNFISSTVNTTLFYGIFVPILLAGTVNLEVNPIVLACIIGATSSLAFGAPSGRAHASLAAGTGWFSIKDMLFYGTSISVLISFIFALIGYPLGDILM
ncbi:MAG TPA: anion permease, partial [Candidatus Ventrimonas merdavium]|nr:anion permease [Candidatus Ventrimonas merdavium]